MVKSYCPKSFSRTWSSLVAVVGTLVVPAMSSGYVFHNLVSDQSGAADHADPDLVNAWGVAFNPNGFVWVADNHSGKSTLYDGLGNKQSLVVNIPGPAGSTGGGAPTGIVFNDGNDFFVGAGTNPAAFIFAGEDGVISAWNPNEPLPAPSTQAIRKIDNSASNAIYKGLARANNGGQDFLYATDFHNGRIDAFNNAFGPASLSGNFTDPDLPAGFAPFGIQAIDGELYVTYAKQDDEAEDDVAGPGLGFVNVFDLNGVLQERLISQGALNAPWGLAKAPADFGEFSGALLVGNFGDGRINAYDESTGMLLGSLSNAAHTPLSIEGLWGLQFGNGLNNQPTNTLFFAAGPGGEEHGAYGRIDVTPEPGGLVLEVLALVGIGLEDALFRRRSIGSK